MVGSRWFRLWRTCVGLLTFSEVSRPNWQTQNCIARWAALGAVLSATTNLFVADILIRTLRSTQQQAGAAQQQVDAARKSLPRSWLYVEPSDKVDARTTSAINSGSVPGGVFDITVEVPVKIHNYGTLPATITDAAATLFMRSMPRAGAVIPSEDPIDAEGRLNPTLAKADAFIAMTGWIGSLILADHQEQSRFPLSFTFTGQPMRNLATQR